MSTKQVDDSSVQSFVKESEILATTARAMRPILLIGALTSGLATLLILWLISNKLDIPMGKVAGGFILLAPSVILLWMIYGLGFVVRLPESLATLSKIIIDEINQTIALEESQNPTTRFGRLRKSMRVLRVIVKLLTSKHTTNVVGAARFLVHPLAMVLEMGAIVTAVGLTTIGFLCLIATLLGIL